MAKQKKEEKSSIDGMKDSLYSRAHQPELHTEQRTELFPESSEHPPVAWPDSKIEPAEVVAAEAANTKHLSFAAKFFIGSFVFFLGAAGLAGYIFFVGTNNISSQNIDLQVLAPSIIDGGKPATFQIIVNNRNQSLLQLVDVSIDFPDNTRDPTDQTLQLKHERQSVGDIAPGEQIKRTTDAVFYGQEGSAQKVLVTLQYSIPNSNSVFQKKAEADFIVGSSPISISVDAPKEAISDQAFDMDVTVTSNSSSRIKDVVLEGQYPFGYTVSNSTPPAQPGNTLWRLGDLAPGESKKVHLSGKILGQDGDQRVFKFLTGADADLTDTSVKVPFIVVPQTLTVHKPFIATSITLNRKSDATVPIEAGRAVSGTISWQNNLTVPVSNVEIVLSLTGAPLDTTSISSVNGFYQSADNTILWKKDQDSDLGTVAPGAKGTLQFSFKTLKPGTNNTVFTNPTVTLNLTVSGIREGQSGVPETVTSAATTIASIASALDLKETSFHTTGPFVNSGPMPPMAETRTTYTVLWTVSNSSNTIANATVSTILPSYVTFVASQDPSVAYDKASRTVTWTIGDLKAGVGFSSPPKSNVFQVAVLPSVSQVGSSPVLTGKAELSGTDRFAQVLVNATADPADTRVKGDPDYIEALGIVQPKQ